MKSKIEMRHNLLVSQNKSKRKSRLLKVCVVYLGTILAAELVAVFAGSSGGIVAYFVIMFTLLIHSALAGESPPYKLFLSITLIPLYRILSLSAPFPDISEVNSYLVVSVPLFVGIIGILKVTGFSLTDIGITKSELRVQVLIAMTGLGFGLIDYLILRPEPYIPELTLAKALVPALVLLVSAGIVEEMAFRGVLQSAARQLGTWGWVYAAIMYSLLHIQHKSALHWVFMLEVALFFGWAVKRRGSIVGVALAHGLMTITLYLVYPFVLE